MSLSWQMNKKQEKIDQLRQHIAFLESRLADLHARLPAHSIPPAMVAELDELDELLEQARAQMAALQAIQNE